MQHRLERPNWLSLVVRVLITAWVRLKFVYSGAMIIAPWNNGQPKMKRKTPPTATMAMVR